MTISDQAKKQIHLLLSKKLESKLKRYSRESTSMPFLAKLMQDNEKVASYSFIHSLATTLGMSIYEEVSNMIASEYCTESSTKYDVGGVISDDQRRVIDNIILELRNGSRTTDIDKEIQEVLNANSDDGKFKKEGRIADFYMLRDGVEHYFEIKTVKPNIDVFTKSKEKILEWVARKKKPIKVYIAFPYNPYHPEPYNRFTLQGVLKPGEDLLIGEDYWNFLGGQNTYEQLLEQFDHIGRLFHEQISEKIREVANLKMKI
ncbi:MAG: TdeIII family type II restriction endonuclease [Bacteroidetes bacterium]|nr:TdeIII family type II restriction endonuclease [Bacteroidota bacterium]